MLFPTHLAGGYIAGRVASVRPSWAVLGAALPDLIDKPLGAVGIMPIYQTIGHSVLALGTVGLAGAIRGGGQPDRRLVAVLVGWGSHLLLDVIGMIANGQPENWVLVLWPIVGKPITPALGPIAFAVEYLGSPSFYLELLIWGGLAVVVVNTSGLQTERTT